MKNAIGNTSEAALLAEYSAANDAYIAYDGYRWQSGSFLIAGVFVYWGFAVSDDKPGAALLGGSAALLITGLMTCWMFFAHHYRQLYMFKLWRIQEIEAALGMEQHLRFSGDREHPPRYRATKPRGHYIDLFVYWLAAVGTALIQLIKNDYSVESKVIGISIVVIVGVSTVFVWRAEQNVVEGSKSSAKRARAITAERLLLAGQTQPRKAGWWPFNHSADK